MAIDRLPIKPGPGFDANNKAHVQAVLDKLATAGEQGVGWMVQSFDPDTGTLTLYRQSAVTQVKKTSRRDYREVALQPGTKPADGEKVAAQLESDPQHAGYYLTKFEPYLGTATLSRMTLDARRARGAVATALGVKPWDVQVKPRAGGGFELGLPPSYVPSKHDDKLQEVAEILGQFGWYFSGDAAKLTGEVVPAEPPAFEPVYEFDFASLPPRPNVLDEDLWRLPLGVALGGRGAPNIPVQVSFDDAVGTLTVGLAGSGKSVRTQCLVFSALARGWEL
ncbi:MAG: hypothetical protein B7X41_17500, partial [Microbacterium sp. 14-71-5]